MTDQLEGPELWLRVAQVMGLEISTNAAGLDPKPIRWQREMPPRSGEGKVRVVFDPDTNGADFAAMHQWVRDKDYDIDYWGARVRRAASFPIGCGCACRIYSTQDDTYSGLGPTDAIALGRAIVEAWG